MPAFPVSLPCDHHLRSALFESCCKSSVIEGQDRQAQGYRSYSNIPSDAPTPEESLSACLPRLLRQVLTSNRDGVYEADTILIDLSVIALCCLSCHRKAPWLSYFKPSGAFKEGYLKNLKKRLSAHLTPPPPGQQTACSHAIYSSIKPKVYLTLNYL